MMAIIPVQAAEREPATPEFTMQQAVEKAMFLNKGLKSSQYDADRSEEVRDYVSDKVEYNATGPAPNSKAESLVISDVQAGINASMAKKNLMVQQDSVVMSVYSAYDTILQAQEKVKVAELTLKQKDWLKRMALVGQKVGTVDIMAVVQATTNYESAKSSLEAAKKALDDDYQKFNQLVGLWPDDRPVLVTIPEITPLEVANLDYEVAKALDISPTVWSAQRKIDLAKLTKQLYDFTDSNSEPYKVKQIDVEKAEVAATDTKDSVSKLVRTLYYSTKQLEEQYAGSQESLRLAEESQRVAKVKFEVGMATNTELLEAELGLAQAKQSLLNISCQHEIQVMAFKKPWAYSSGS
jgi:outer membrane protein TolC